MPVDLTDRELEAAARHRIAAALRYADDQQYALASAELARAGQLLRLASAAPGVAEDMAGQGYAIPCASLGAIGHALGTWPLHSFP